MWLSLATDKMFTFIKKIDIYSYIYLYMNLRLFGCIHSYVYICGHEVLMTTQYSFEVDIDDVSINIVCQLFMNVTDFPDQRSLGMLV